MPVAYGSPRDKQYRRALEWRWGREQNPLYDQPPVFDLSSILMPNYLRRPRYVQQWDFYQDLQNTLLAPVADPFVPVDFTNPMLRVRQRIDWLHLSDTQLIGQDVLYGDPGQVPVQVFENPFRAPRRQQPDPTGNTLFVVTVELPPGQSTLPSFVIRRPGQPPEFLQDLQGTLLAVAADVPFLPLLVDNPRLGGRLRHDFPQQAQPFVLTSPPPPEGRALIEVRFVPPRLRGVDGFPNVTLLGGEQAPLVAVNWLNPPLGARRGQQGGFTVNLTPLQLMTLPTGRLPPFPGRGPLRARPSFEQSARTWLIGQDAMVTARGHTNDWQLPVLPIRYIVIRDNYGLNLALLTAVVGEIEAIMRRGQYDPTVSMEARFEEVLRRRGFFEENP